MQPVEIVRNDDRIVKADHYSRTPSRSIDDYLTMLCLERSFGEVYLLRDQAKTLKVHWTASVIVDAVLEKDVTLIDEIAKRVDGSVPDSEERDNFANIFGDALEDVLSYTAKEQCIIRPEDPAIIALAKALIYISLDHPGSNQAKRKDKQKAVQMILSRSGGRKTKPTGLLTTTVYVEPEWMKGLGDGSEVPDAD